MGSYHELVIQKYHLKRNTGNHGPSPEPPTIKGTPWARPWDQLGIPWGYPRDRLGPPRTFSDDKNRHISLNLHRPKLSLAASDCFRCNALFQELPPTILSFCFSTNTSENQIALLQNIHGENSQASSLKQLLVASQA